MPFDYANSIEQETERTKNILDIINSLKTCTHIELDSTNNQLELATGYDKLFIPVDRVEEASDTNVLELSELLNNEHYYSSIKLKHDSNLYTNCGFFGHNGFKYTSFESKFSKKDKEVKLEDCKAVFWVLQNSDECSVMIISKSDNKEKRWFATLITSKNGSKMHVVYAEEMSEEI